MFIANWKMNMLRADAEQFCAQFSELISKLPEGTLSNCTVGIAPAFLAIDSVKRALTATGLKSIQVGAQNCHWLEKGAHTGELSPLMLNELGCDFVILGHSERRQFYGETNEGVAKRAQAVLAHGLRAIVCVGETESEYRSKQTLQVVESQLAGSLGEIQDDVIEKGSSVGLVIAYEPVWAIGTGLAATPEIAVSVHAHIRRWLNSRFRGDLGIRIPILYGGSTTADNIYELCSRDNIDGALVGGASLKPDSFTQLCQHGSRALANR